MTLKEKLSAISAERLATTLVTLYDENPALQKQLDMLFAGLEDKPTKLKRILKKEISSLRRDPRFIDYYQSRSFAGEIDAIRLRIFEDLKSKSPADAFELMEGFLNTHEVTLNRADDSNGDVGEVFREACRDFGEIAKVTSFDALQLAEKIFNKFMNNDYGIYDDIIKDFKESLKNEGLDFLKEKLLLSDREKKGYAIQQGLQIIADCRGDVDDYIKARFLKGEIHGRGCLDVAERLINHWRIKEALEWIEKVNLKENALWRGECHDLRIKALELEGSYDSAQGERLLWFEESLSVKTYEQILKNGDEKFKESFRQDAIKKAFNFSAPHTAVRFLMESQEIEALREIIRLKHDQLYGRDYSLLRPVASLLEEVDPIAASLIYRRMGHPVLEEAKSKYYKYAAKDLVRCEVLSHGIKDWGNIETHEAYFKEFQESHKRKISFWREYESLKDQK